MKIRKPATPSAAVVWALRLIQERRGRPTDVLDVLGLPLSDETQNLASTILSKTAQVYFFRRDGKVKNISNLDPGADETDEAGWGGLTEFSSNVSEVVARVVNRAEREES